MTTLPELPDIARADVDLVVANRWQLATARLQRAAAQAVMAEWERRTLPPQLISFNCLLGSDGPGVFTYAQWTSADAVREFAGKYRADGQRAIQRALPGFQIPPPVQFRLYRSFVPDRAPRAAGCVVLVSVEATDDDLARQWIDAVLDALSSEDKPQPGLISAHFHISRDGADGTKIMNYAEWEDEQFHRDALTNSPTQGIAQIDSEQWRRVLAMPGIKPAGITYYRPYRSLPADGGR